MYAPRAAPAAPKSKGVLIVLSISIAWDEHMTIGACACQMA